MVAHRGQLRGGDPFRNDAFDRGMVEVAVAVVVFDTGEVVYLVRVADYQWYLGLVGRCGRGGYFRLRFGLLQGMEELGQLGVVGSAFAGQVQGGDPVVVFGCGEILGGCARG